MLLVSLEDGMDSTGVWALIGMTQLMTVDMVMCVCITVQRGAAWAHMTRARKTKVVVEQSNPKDHSSEGISHLAWSRPGSPRPLQRA